MKLFRKREPLSRRSARLWMLRFRKAGIVFCAVALVAAGGWHAHKNALVPKAAVWAAEKTMQASAAAGFRVTDILVTGRERIEPAALLARLDIRQGMPVFAVDIEKTRQSLSEIAWVNQVSVTRRLPGTIIVGIEERAPAALWQYQKKLSVIDATGRVLASKNLAKYAHLPLVVGEGAPESAGGLLALLRAEPEIAKILASAVRVGGRRWDLKLKNGLTVKLPEKDTELALRRLAAAGEKHGIFGKNIATIDLRIPDRMVVEPGPEQGKKTI